MRAGVTSSSRFMMRPSNGAPRLAPRSGLSRSAPALSTAREAASTPSLSTSACRTNSAMRLRSIIALRRDLYRRMKKTGRLRNSGGQAGRRRGRRYAVTGHAGIAGRAFVIGGAIAADALVRGGVAGLGISSIAVRICGAVVGRVLRDLVVRAGGRKHLLHALDVRVDRL